MKLGAVLAGLVGSQLVVAFLTQAMIIAVLGAGVLTDCFVAAQTVPMVILSIVATGLLNVWQTYLAVVGDEDRAAAFASSLGFGLMLAGGLLAFVLLSSDVLVAGLFPGFDEQRLRLTAELMRIVSIGTAFTICTVPAIAAGRAAGKFVRVEAIALLFTILALVALPVVLPRYGVIGAAWLLSLRAFLIFAATSGAMRMTWPTFRPDPHKRYALAQLRPVLLGSSLYKMGPVVDRFWGSKAGPGGLTLYNFAAIGATAAGSVIERALAAPVVPEIARTWHGVGPREVMRLVHRALIKVWGLCALLMLAMLPVGLVWTSLCAYFLHLDAGQSSVLFHLAIAFMLQLGTTASGTLLVSIFYTADKTRESVRIITAVFILGVMAKSFAFSVYGLLGMAVANSLQLIGTSVALYLGAVRLARLHERDCGNPTPSL